MANVRLISDPDVICSEIGSNKADETRTAAELNYVLV